MLKIIICGSLLLMCHVHGVVILVHGTFAHQADWYKPGGDFFQELKSHAQRHNHDLIYHSWSGSLKNTERIKAAKELATSILGILEIQQREPIVLVGHSHGGTVIFLASNLLQTSNPHVHFKSIEDASLFFESYQEVQKLKRNLNLVDNQYIIDRTYLLGTPINTNMISPDMHIIGTVINLYSYADYIQTMLGLYNQIIANKERTINLEVYIDDNSITNKPSHVQMHHPLIGRSLLHIGTKSLENHWKLDGIVVFHPENLPAYVPTQKKQQPKLNPHHFYGWY